MTLSILLYVYMAILAAFIVFAIINILHVVLLTATDRASYLVTVIFLIAFIVIISTSWIMLQDIQWSEPLFSQDQTTTNLFQ